MELCTPGLLGSLITNLTSDFYFSKWRIQYGGHEILETLRFSHNSELGGFQGRWLRIFNWIFRIPYSGSNMAYIKFRNLSSFIKILCLDVSEVSVHDSDILRLAKTKYNDEDVVEFCLIRGAWLEWVYNTKFLGNSVSSCPSHRHTAGSEKALCTFLRGVRSGCIKKNVDEKVTAPNLKDSGSDNSGCDAERKKEVMRELWMLS